MNNKVIPFLLGVVVGRLMSPVMHCLYILTIIALATRIYFLTNA
jgi:hypothetical protein